jgi:hypothetical protein
MQQQRRLAMRQQRPRLRKPVAPAAVPAERLRRWSDGPAGGAGAWTRCAGAGGVGEAGLGWAESSMPLDRDNLA